MVIIQKRLNAIATIEMAYIMPIVLLILLATTYLGFFFHDKNMLQSIVYEALLIGESQNRNEGAVVAEELEMYIANQSERKLLYFDVPLLTIDEQQNQIRITAKVEKNNMNIVVDKSMPIIEPEKEIRKVRRIQGVLDGGK